MNECWDCQFFRPTCYEGEDEDGIGVWFGYCLNELNEPECPTTWYKKARSNDSCNFFKLKITTLDNLIKEVDP